MQRSGMIKHVLDKLSPLRSKLSPLMAEFTRTKAGRWLKQFTPGFFAWSVSTIVLTYFVIFMLTKIFFAGSHLSGQAIETGQRVFIQVSSGEVEGNARHTKVTAPPLEASTSSTTPGETPVINKDALTPAPLASISAQTDKGVVPMVGSDGTLPWKYYARPYKPSGKPMVTIILTDLGLSKPLTEEALKLPHDITLSFSPYASDARKWAQQARENGFESLVDLPMQTADYLRTGSDPGPYGLLENLGSNETSARLRWIMSRFPGFTGVLAPENETLTANATVIRPTLIELAGHGVLFLYIKTPKNEALAELAKARQYYAIGIDKVIDDDIALGPIGTQLDSLTALAKTQGYAIGFGHAYPPTLEALRRWSDELGAEGVDLVPVSAVAMKVLP